MKYFEWIEPYLNESLSPEEEKLFERQLELDPELKETLARHFAGRGEGVPKLKESDSCDSKPGVKKKNTSNIISLPK